MKRIIYFTLLMILSASQSYAQSSLYINKTDGTTSTFLLSEIESLTFTGGSTSEEGLIAHWPFDGNANDVVGNNHGTPMNGTALTEDRNGKAESAYLFEGGDDYIQLSTHLGDLTELSVSLWVKYTKIANQVGDILVDASEDPGHDFRLDVRDTGIGVTANKNDALLNIPNGNAVTGLNLKDSWHHIVWTMSPTQSKIYVDGQLLATIDETASNVGFHSDHAVIGAFYKNQVTTAPLKNFFVGSLDDLRLYNKVLTQAEVSGLFNR